MAAVLPASGIDAVRKADAKGAYAVKVEAPLVARAIGTLKAGGYPVRTFETPGEVFDAQGIIGTAFKQHVRDIHAMNQDLPHKISRIAAVRDAGVLVTAPVKGRHDRDAPTANASVTINFDCGFATSDNLPQIKKLGPSRWTACPRTTSPPRQSPRLTQGLWCTPRRRRREPGCRRSCRSRPVLAGARSLRRRVLRGSPCLL